ncbi:hypothetical protein [Actinocorallia aurantiaca]|uniref:Uncharacterized protein n=1 Tax=Actinocorallia aurantiaca TaxID=46204 RepID=A0ABP6GP08_9ACTN
MPDLLPAVADLVDDISPGSRALALRIPAMCGPAALPVPTVSLPTSPKTTNLLIGMPGSVGWFRTSPVAAALMIRRDHIF